MKNVLAVLTLIVIVLGSVGCHDGGGSSDGISSGPGAAGGRNGGSGTPADVQEDTEKNPTEEPDGLAALQARVDAAFKVFEDVRGSTADLMATNAPRVEGLLDGCHLNKREKPIIERLLVCGCAGGGDLESYLQSGVQRFSWYQFTGCMLPDSMVFEGRFDIDAVDIPAKWSYSFSRFGAPEMKSLDGNIIRENFTCRGTLHVDIDEASYDCAMKADCSGCTLVQK